MTTNESAKSMIYIPGFYVCRKCKFELISKVLDMAGGKVVANPKREMCPNDQEVMEKVTWRERCEWYETRSEQIFKNGYELGRRDGAEINRFEKETKP